MDSHMTQPRIDSLLVIDKDPLLGLMLSKLLEVEATHISSFREIESLSDEFRPSGVFLGFSLMDDVMPRECGKIRSRWPDAPVIVIVDGFESEIQIRALALAGVEDFIKKPFTAYEVKARFLARQAVRLKHFSDEVIVFADTELNIASREISGPLGKRYLSPTEVAILNCLIQSEGRLVTRESLKMQCWGSSLVTNNALDRHIHGVRAAVKKVSTSVKMRSVYGKGYLVEAEVRRLLETEKLAS